MPQTAYNSFKNIHKHTWHKVVIMTQKNTEIKASYCEQHLQMTMSRKHVRNT